MKSPFPFLFSRFSRHRNIIAVGIILLAASSWLILYHTPLSSDIAALLPDRGSRTAADFKLLARAPLTRRLLVNLRAGNGIDQETLLATADRLAGELKPPLFQHVITGPEIKPGPELLAIGYQWDNLMTSTDLETVSQLTTNKAIDRALARARQTLLGPISFFQKDRVRSDPLNFSSLIFAKLRSLNPIAGADLVKNHFFSRDGRNTLLIIETPIEITDYEGSEKLLRKLNQTLEKVVPKNIRATALSGHFYTVANARSIKRDMLVVISASLLALVLIFMVFLRTPQGVIVFFLPLIVVGPALALTAWIQGSVSAITAGFGAVLLGVTIDYALHPYFALRAASRETSTRQLISNLSPPIIGAGITTIGAFSTQLFSSLPGQRQLAMFAIAGVLMALFISLLLLPHFLRTRKPESDFPNSGKNNLAPVSGTTQRSPVIIILWGVAMAVCAWSATGLKYSGDLRRLNLAPEKLRHTEAEYKKTWNGVRQRSLIFISKPDRESALRQNDDLYARLCRHFSPTEIVSFSPVAPAIFTQTANRKLWHDYWDRKRTAALAATLNQVGKRYGFSRNAFAPFLANLKQEHPFLTEEYWCKLGLEPLFDALQTKTPEGFTILSLVPDQPEIIEKLEREDTLSDAVFVSPALFNLEVGQVIARELQHSVILALLIVTLILIVWLRRPFQVFLALLPVISGLLTMFGIMGLLGYSFNLFNLVATILMIGLGVDYGIFMVYRLFHNLDPSAEKAVLVSALTTLSGFGVLVLARHPALHSIGLTILLGVCGALPTVLWVLPSLAGSFPIRQSKSVVSRPDDKIKKSASGKP